MRTRVLAEDRAPMVSGKKRVRSAGEAKPKRRPSLLRPPRTIIEAHQRDREWIAQNLDRLLAERGHVYLAVKDHEIFGADPDENTLIMTLRQKYGEEGFLVISLDDPRLRGEEDDLQLQYDGAIDEQDLDLPSPPYTT